MSKLSPLTEEEIREFCEILSNYAPGKERRLILAYAHAKAEAERLKWQQAHHENVTWDCATCGPRCEWNDKPYDELHKWTDADWLNAVLTRIGWEDKV